MKFRFNKKIFLYTLLFLLVFGSGIGASYFYFVKKQKPEQLIVENEQNKYIAFISEVYDLIIQNYWDKIDEKKLNVLFTKATEKLTGQVVNKEYVSKAEILQFIEENLSNWTEEEKQKEYITQMSDMVLANLEPFGRSRLYTQKEETSLSNNVTNKNPERNRYDDLEVDKNASQEEIENSYKVLAEKWNPEVNEATEAAEKYQAVQDAYKTLKDKDSREVYNQSGVEPTMEYELIRPSVLYIHMSKFSPTTYDELQRVTTKFQGLNDLDSLILDVSNNIGGAIDLLPYFLGPFIGENQYAYQFFHQGEAEDYKTKIGWLPGLVQYKKVVVLTNGEAQSSAEVMAATLKKYNVGVLVGTKTKGWGTVERVFPIESQIAEGEKYSAFLVHSLTLREDGKPIQGNGVEPMIDISSFGWKEELMSYYNSQTLVDAVEEAWNKQNR